MTGLRRRAADYTVRDRVHQLVEDERHVLSSARVGLWVTMGVVMLTIAADLWLTLATPLTARVPNTVYAIEGTMLTVFATWAAGPRIAQYIGPQISGVASGIAQATRDAIDRRRKLGGDDGTEPT